MIIGSVLLLERLKRSADGQEHLPQWFLSPANCQQMLLPSSPEEEVKAGEATPIQGQGQGPGGRLERP